MARLRILLAAAPRPFTELAAEVFTGADGPRAEAALAALVSVGAKIRDGTGSPVLSARYHLFARATEGAFTCLNPGRPHVSLARREVCPDCPGTVFEFGCCKRCGAIHLAGSVERGLRRRALHVARGAARPPHLAAARRPSRDDRRG